MISVLEGEREFSVLQSVREDYTSVNDGKITFASRVKVLSKSQAMKTHLHLS
jgi:hypothetical protein